MSDPFYRLYCKQQELESAWHDHWACGFASLVSCFRILGDRTTENEALVREFRTFGKPRDGMTTDEAVRLAREFGYSARVNRGDSRRDWNAFEIWLDANFAARKPVMLSVDSKASQEQADHWWMIYGDPDESNIWVMDPFITDSPFELLSRAEIESFASCSDTDGFIEFDGVAIESKSASQMIAIPPSATLMEFINEGHVHEKGWSSEQIAAALVDNHFSTISELAPAGPRRVPVWELLEDGAAVDTVIDHWDTFFSESQLQNINQLRHTLRDIEAHANHSATPGEQDHLVREIALNLILIGTNLMDG